MKQTSGLLVLGATLLLIVGTLDGCATVERQQAAETARRSTRDTATSKPAKRSRGI
jgi:uncharacterized protein YceK